MTGASIVLTSGSYLCERYFLERHLKRSPVKISMGDISQGFQPLWNSGKTLKMSFQFSSQGNLGGKTHTQKSGKLREFVKVTQKGKGFAILGYVRLVPCVQVVFIG